MVELLNIQINTPNTGKIISCPASIPRLKNNKEKSKSENRKQSNLRSIYYKKECPIKNTV